jgi:hypothetical protein
MIKVELVLGGLEVTTIKCNIGLARVELELVGFQSVSRG